MANQTSATTTVSGGTSIAGLLGIAFVVLKLTHVINWSWWLVTLPFWGGLALFLAVLILGLIIWLLIKGWKRVFRKTNL